MLGHSLVVVAATLLVIGAAIAVVVNSASTMSLPMYRARSRSMHC
jgi:hypothetical protein